MIKLRKMCRILLELLTNFCMIQCTLKKKKIEHGRFGIPENCMGIIFIREKKKNKRKKIMRIVGNQ